MYKNKLVIFIVFLLLSMLIGLSMYIYQTKKTDTSFINVPIVNTIVNNTSNFIGEIKMQKSSTTKNIESKNNKEQESIEQKLDGPVEVNAGTEIMAWIYPGDPSCNAPVEFADGRKIDVLKAEYFTINNNGQLTLLTVTDGCNGYSTQNISLLKKYSTAQYVTISSNNTESMRIFLNQQIDISVETLVSFVVQNNITGVELDFEDFSSWTEEDYSSYKKFVTLLGNALYSKSKKLMIDGPAVSSVVEEKWYMWRYEDFVNLPVDQIVIMIYDYQFDQGVGSPVAPIGWIKNVINWTSIKYPDKEKLVIGLPSYGYKGVEGTHRTELLTYEQIQKEPGFKTAKRDVSSGEMTWTNGVTRYFYQDSESLRQKRAIVESLGIVSISVWHLGGNEWFDL